MWPLPNRGKKEKLGEMVLEYSHTQTGWHFLIWFSPLGCPLACQMSAFNVFLFFSVFRQSFHHPPRRTNQDPLFCKNSLNINIRGVLELFEISEICTLRSLPEARIESQLPVNPSGRGEGVRTCCCYFVFILRGDNGDASSPAVFFDAPGLVSLNCGSP